MSSAEPATSEPTGAPSPFDRQHETVSNGAAHCAAGIPLASTAFQMRAPSRCRRRPRARAASADRAQLLEREDPPAAAVVRVLDADHASAREVVVGGIHRRAQLVGA